MQGQKVSWRFSGELLKKITHFVTAGSKDHQHFPVILTIPNFLRSKIQYWLSLGSSSALPEFSKYII